jgi:myo-inositol 2-dehydrogenase/D-chiro-inositol 1-dehydrogenase
MSELRVAVLGVGLMGADHVARIDRKIKGARAAVVNDFVAEKASRSPPASTAAGPSPIRWTPSPTRRSTRWCWPPPARRTRSSCWPAWSTVSRCSVKSADHRSGDIAGGGQAEAGTGPPAHSGRVHASHRRGVHRAEGHVGAARELGKPLVMHCAHRNRGRAARFDSAMVVRDSLVHEVDVTRFIFGEEITSIQIVKPSANPAARRVLADPQIGDSADRLRQACGRRTVLSRPSRLRGAHRGGRRKG